MNTSQFKNEMGLINSQTLIILSINDFQNDIKKNPQLEFNRTTISTVTYVRFLVY